MKFFSKSLATILLTSLALSAQASVVTTLADATAIVIPAGFVFTASKEIAPGITFTASSASSGVYGYTGSYGFSGNGSWTTTPMVAINDGSGYFEITFTDSVSGFLSQVNWTGNYAGDASMSIYSASNNLLETLVLEHNGANLVAASSYYGFSRQTADIARVRFSNEFIGARNMSFVRAAEVPEPGSLALFGLALAAATLVRRRK